MHQRHLLGRPGIVVAQPAQRQLEHRPRPVKAAVFALEVGNLFGRRHLPQLWQFRAVEPVDPGDDLAELTRQHRPRICKLFVAQDLARDGFALDTLHDEAGAELVFRPQDMHHARRRQAGVIGELHQRRLGVEASGTSG